MLTCLQMNYASVFLVFILGCAAVFWYIGGRSYYTGPIVEARAEESETETPSRKELEV